MKIKTLLLISSLFFSYSFFAQEISEDYDLTWSQPNKYKDDLTFLGAKKTDDGYLVFDKETIKGPGGWRYYIEFFNHNMEFEKKIDISAEVDEDNYRIVDVLNYGDNFLLITSRFFKKEKREEFYIQSIGEANQVIGERILIHEEQTYKKKQRSTFKLSVSPNDKYLLFQVTTGFRKKVEKTLSLILLDDKLNVQWSKDNVIFDVGESSSQFLTTYNIIIKDSGEIYFLVSEKLTKDSEDNAKAYYQILKMSNGEFTGEAITLENDALRGMDIKLSKENKLYCIGFYSENPEGRSREGVASLVIDSDLSDILSESYSLYDKKHLIENLEGRQLKKVEKQIEENEDLFNELVNEDIFLHEDGSLTLVAEIQYHYTYTSGVGENQSTKTVFVYGSLYLTRIEANGDIISSTILSKSNSYSRPMEKHNLMYSSNHKLIRISHEVRPHFKNHDENKSKKDRLLAVATIDEDGEQTEYALFDPADKEEHKKDRLGNIASNGVVLSNNEIILLFKHSKKEYKFVRISSLLDE